MTYLGVYIPVQMQVLCKGIKNRYKGQCGQCSLFPPSSTSMGNLCNKEETQGEGTVAELLQNNHVRNLDKVIYSLHYQHDV